MARNLGIEIPFDPVFSRVQKVLGFDKDIQFAKYIDIKPSVVHGAKKRDSFPITWAFMLSEKVGLSIDWILFGKGNTYLGKTPESEGNKSMSSVLHAVHGSEWTQVPQYRDRLSAGPGSFVENGGGDTVGSFTFKTAWLRRKCQPNQCAVFHVSGDSMFPLIQDGDVVLVDLGQNELQGVREGKIYAFSEGDLIRVKRLIFKGSGELWAISDNKQTSPDTVIDMATFSLIGRVVWVGHEVW